MKPRSLLVGVAIVLLLLLFTFIFENKHAFASDQKLVHGAGTLPHLTSAITLNLGYQILTPVWYSLRYDIGLGNRVQLGFSTCIQRPPGRLFLVEIHSMFNVLKTARDSDFLSLYLNPGIGGSSGGSYYDYKPDTDYRYLSFNSGVAYEHRFGSKRRIGLYTKVGVLVFMGYEPGELREGDEYFYIDGRVGFQALIGKRFSIALEPELAIDIYVPFPYPFGKIAFTWAF